MKKLIINYYWIEIPMKRFLNIAKNKTVISQWIEDILSKLIKFNVHEKDIHFYQYTISLLNINKIEDFSFNV